MKFGTLIHTKGHTLSCTRYEEKKDAYTLGEVLLATQNIDRKNELRRDYLWKVAFLYPCGLEFTLRSHDQHKVTRNMPIGYT
jgi:hypothetical protein